MKRGLQRSEKARRENRAKGTFSCLSYPRGTKKEPFWLGRSDLRRVGRGGTHDEMDAAFSRLVKRFGCGIPREAGPRTPRTAPTPQRSVRDVEGNGVALPGEAIRHV